MDGRKGARCSRTSEVQAVIPADDIARLVCLGGTPGTSTTEHRTALHLHVRVDEGEDTAATASAASMTCEGGQNSCQDPSDNNGNYQTAAQHLLLPPPRPFLFLELHQVLQLLKTEMIPSPIYVYVLCLNFTW